MNRCIYSWSDIGVNSTANKDARGQKQRIIRYCAQKASDYYNELHEAYSACRLRMSPANFNEESTNEVIGCMDETAINYDPTATSSVGIGGICEYADDNQWGATDEYETRPDPATDSLRDEVKVAAEQEQGKDEFESEHGIHRRVGCLVQILWEGFLMVNAQQNFLTMKSRCVVERTKTFR